MKALWIADAHLTQPDSDGYASLQDLLLQYAERMDCLVILGDLFALWLGDNRILLEKHAPLLKTLTDLRHRGKRIYYLKGNHDFLLGKIFEEEIQAEIFEGDAIFEWDGYRFFASHGDTIDSRDYGYRILRRILRGPWTARIVGALKDEQTLRIGMRLAKTAKATPDERRIKGLASSIRNFAVGILQKDIQAVILAHTHRKCWEVLNIGGEQRLYLNPGSWLEERTFLWTSGGTFELRQMDSGQSRILFDFSLQVH